MVTRECLCYAMSPQGMIPLVKRSRVPSPSPSHSYVNYSVSYSTCLLYVIKTVAAECVAECGGLIPR